MFFYHDAKTVCFELSSNPLSKNVLNAHHHGGILGGLSNFSPQRGFACDNILDYEVVLANGDVVHANESSNSDLWIALRGGSNNFGIVTAFTARAFPQSKSWGGMHITDISHAPKQLEYFYNLVSNPKSDGHTSLEQCLLYHGPRGGVEMVNNILHSTTPEVNPEALRPFTALAAIHDSTRVSTLSDFTSEVDGECISGARYAKLLTTTRVILSLESISQHTSPTDLNLRQLTRTTTFKNNLQILQKAHDLFTRSTPELKSIKGIIWALIVQPLGPDITSKSAPLGGNSLGLSPDDGALVIAEISATWDDGADDAAVKSQAKTLVDALDHEARVLGVAHDYRYLNYADRDQDPIGGYGQEVKERLQRVSRKYDPEGLFQRACSGGFKLF